MRKKIPALILILIFILMAFSGCMELQRGINVKANGDVECYTVVYMSESDMKYIYDTPEKFYEALQSKIDDEFPIESFEKIQKTEGKENWYGARASYVIDKSEVDHELDKMFSDYDVDYKTSGFLIKKVEVTIESKGKSLTSMFTDLMKDPEDSLFGYINQTTKNEFAIQVPYPIVSTNGSTGVGMKNTVVWNMKSIDSMGGDEITMTVSYVNLPAVLILGAIILVIIILLIVLLVIRRKKKKKAMAQMGQAMQPQVMPQGIQQDMQNPTPAAPQPMPAQPQIPEVQVAPQVQPQEVPTAQPQQAFAPVKRAELPPPEPPKEEMGDVPQVAGLPAIGLLPKTEIKEENEISKED